MCDNVDVATLRYSTATELRVDVIASTDGLDDRRFIIDVPAHGAPIYTAETTMQAADDDAAGCWPRLLRRSQRRAGAGRLCNEPMIQ